MSKMKKLIFVLVGLLCASQALALDSESIRIRITINQEPVVTGLAPKDGSVVTEGDTLVISVEAQDPNTQDVLQYQYWIKDQVKQDWTTSNTFSYVPTSNDLGSNRIKVKVTDGKKTIEVPQPPQEVEIYVFRSTVNVP